jgi:hypothetical protein
MHIQFNEDQTRSLIQMLLSEIAMHKDLLEMEENFSKHAGEAILEKDEEIKKLKDELKILKPVKRGRPKKIVKRGPGRPKKAVA